MILCFLDDADEEGDHGANGAGNGNDQAMDESQKSVPAILLFERFYVMMLNNYYSKENYFLVKKKI